MPRLTSRNEGEQPSEKAASTLRESDSVNALPSRWEEPWAPRVGEGSGTTQMIGETGDVRCQPT